MASSTDTDKLIDSLSADPAPVRRLRPPTIRLALWLVVQSTFAAFAFSGGVRPDIDHQLRSIHYLLELVILATSILLLARASFAAGIPAGERWTFSRIALGGAAIALLLSIGHGAATGQAIGAFVTKGLPCAAWTTVLSLLPTSWLLVAIHRGAALRPARAGLVAGASGFLVGFTMMRVLCPIDDALHLTAWHWGPVLLGSALSAVAGALLFSRWRK